MEALTFSMRALLQTVLGGEGVLAGGVSRSKRLARFAPRSGAARLAACKRAAAGEDILTDPKQRPQRRAQYRTSELPAPELYRTPRASELRARPARSWRGPREDLAPPDTPRALHGREAREDRADGDRQAGEALEETRVGEQHQVDELSERRFPIRELRTHDKSQIANHQSDRHYRGNREREVDGDVIHQIGHQEMEGEERRCQESVVHRMEVDAADGDDDEHHREKEQQRYRGEEGDLTGERPGLEFLRHVHADLESREEIRVAPLQSPPATLLDLLGRGKRVLREVDVIEVRAHCQLEIAHLGDVIAEYISPVGQST